MAESFNERSPARSRGVGCLTFVIILIALAAALFFFRDRWLPPVSQMLGLGPRAETPVDTGDDESITVYVLPEGYVYHRSGCSLMKDKGAITAINLRQARAGGYKPCTKCNPPK